MGALERPRQFHRGSEKGGGWPNGPRQEICTCIDYRYVYIYIYITRVLLEDYMETGSV